MARNGMRIACTVGVWQTHLHGFCRTGLIFEVGRGAMTKGQAIRSALGLIRSQTILRCAAHEGGLGPRFGRLRRGEAGSTVAETALVLPVLLVVLTGIFSFGIILNQYLVLTNAVNGGARGFAASAPGSDGGYSIMDSGDPCEYAATTIQNSASNLTASNLTYTITYTTAKTAAVTTYNGTGSSSPSCSDLPMSQGDSVVIKAVYPVTPVMFGWSSKTFSLTAQSAELVQ
jgi:Flp pilus assembly protein TadG